MCCLYDGMQQSNLLTQFIYLISKLNIMKKIKLFTLALAAIFAGSAMAEEVTTGTYSVRTINGAESAWAYDFKPVSDINIPSGVENGVYYSNTKGGNQKVSKSGYLSNKAESTIGFEVPSATAEGTITMTVGSSSDGRYYQLFVNGTASGVNQRLWSKAGDDLEKKGPQSYTFTSADISTIDGKYYLTFKDNNTEMKPATFKVVLTNDYYENLAPNNAALKSITVDGEALEGFDPATETYNVELPFGTTTVPTVAAVAASKKATAVVTPATAIPGATTILVTAEDATTTKTYTINFTAAQTASSEKELLNVTVGGKAVAISENAGSLLVSKSADLTALVINFEVSESATASIESGSAQDFTNPLSIVVTAQDNSTATYTITVTKAVKDVLYLTAASTEGDKMYAVVAAKGFYVDARKNGTNTDFSGYDLVVLHESLTGKDAASGELSALATANVPVLNTKSYFYPEGRWGWGAAANGNDQQGVKVNTAKYTNIASHPLFAGLSDTITIYNTAVAKNIQPITSFVEGKEGYVLANVAGGAAIHELPAAARVGAEGTAKYLLISLLNGQYADLTAEAETLLSNAVDYLMSAEAWVPQSGPSTAVDNAVVAEKAQKMIINGQLVIVKDGVRYNAQGVQL